MQPPASMLGILTPPSFMAACMPPAPVAATAPSPSHGSPVFDHSPLFGSSVPASSAPMAPLPFTPSVPPLSGGIGASPMSTSPLGASPMGSLPIGGVAGLPPGVLPPPIFGQGGATPLSPMGGAAPKATGPSDFTRLISQAAAPVVPLASTPAAAKPVTIATPAKRTIPMGLIVVINTVILLAVIVIVFVLRKPQPSMPSKPAVPKVPSVSAPALK
ncbi:hypothetical protein [Gemmatimonas sp.]|uniref:hypothetical protein n=1 Tax=Gemmatimonas sp. TaxID=1962908 RepID=UPI003564252C